MGYHWVLHSELFVGFFHFLLSAASDRAALPLLGWPMEEAGSCHDSHEWMDRRVHGPWQAAAAGNDASSLCLCQSHRI